MSTQADENHKCRKKGCGEFVEVVTKNFDPVLVKKGNNNKRANYIVYSASVNQKEGLHLMFGVITTIVTNIAAEKFRINFPLFASSPHPTMLVTCDIETNSESVF